MVTDFGANRRKLACPPSFCALAFHNVWKNRTIDARVYTADDLSTSESDVERSPAVLSRASRFDKNLVNYGPVTPEFFRRVCAGRAIRWSSLVVVVCFLAFIALVSQKSRNIEVSCHRPLFRYFERRVSPFRASLRRTCHGLEKIADCGNANS